MITKNPKESESQLKHGEWIPEYEKEGNYAHCSECGCRCRGYSPNYKYCPECGARMDKIVYQLNPQQRAIRVIESILCRYSLSDDEYDALEFAQSSLKEQAIYEAEKYIETGPYKVIKNRFNRLTPKIKQIFCRHKWNYGVERPRGYYDEHCEYVKCEKCGKFKRIEYYKREPIDEIG